MRTINEYYKFFEAIPEDRWIKGFYAKRIPRSVNTGDFLECHCAGGHLGVRIGVDQVKHKAYVALTQLFAVELHADIEAVNDLPGATAKENILAALQFCAELGAEIK